MAPRAFLLPGVSDHVTIATKQTAFSLKVAVSIPSTIVQNNYRVKKKKQFNALFTHCGGAVVGTIHAQFPSREFLFCSTRAWCAANVGLLAKNRVLVHVSMTTISPGVKTLYKIVEKSQGRALGSFPARYDRLFFRTPSSNIGGRHFIGPEERDWNRVHAERLRGIRCPTGAQSYRPNKQ